MRRWLHFFQGIFYILPFWYRLSLFVYNFFIIVCVCVCVCVKCWFWKKGKRMLNDVWEFWKKSFAYKNAVPWTVQGWWLVFINNVYTLQIHWHGKIWNTTMIFDTIRCRQYKVSGYSMVPKYQPYRHISYEILLYYVAMNSY